MSLLNLAKNKQIPEYGEELTMLYQVETLTRSVVEINLDDSVTYKHPEKVARALAVARTRQEYGSTSIFDCVESAEILDTGESTDDSYDRLSDFYDIKCPSLAAYTATSDASA